MALPIDALLLGAIAILAPLAVALAYRVFGGSDGTTRVVRRVRSILRSRLDAPLPETREVSSEFIEEALADADLAGDAIDLYFTDATYYAPVPGDVSESTDAMTVTAMLPYQPELFDCDDFTGLFWALTKLVNGVNATAMVFDWSGEHAYNIIVDSAGDVHIVEPQTRDTDRLNSDYYARENALVVF